MTHIDPTARIGAFTNIGRNVYIGAGVRIGARCIIQSGAVIGHDGFGYTRDPDSLVWRPKPHRCGVTIEDDVHIGANTCIDRGSWRDTRIEQGARIDNLVHIAHNAIIGRNAVVVAHAMIAGSCLIEDGAWIGPCSSILQHIRVGERALVGMGSVVLADVESDTTVAGVPARVINTEAGVRDEM